LEHLGHEKKETHLSDIRNLLFVTMAEVTPDPEKMQDVEQTYHDEQAVSAPQGYRVLEVDPAVERTVVRKIDRNLMPLVMALCTWDGTCDFGLSRRLILTSQISSLRSTGLT
jgi:hypothetical protein